MPQKDEIPGLRSARPASGKAHCGGEDRQKVDRRFWRGRSDAPYTLIEGETGRSKSGASHYRYHVLGECLIKSLPLLPHLATQSEACGGKVGQGGCILSKLSERCDPAAKRDRVGILFGGQEWPVGLATRHASIYPLAAR